MTPPPPNQMKKKVVSILSAVLVGHAGLLWAVSQMKTPELKPVDPDWHKKGELFQLLPFLH